MKRVFAILAAGLLTSSLFTQSPQKMSYQAVIRDALNHLVTTQVGMQISILQGSESGTAVYVETQTPTPNINGLITIEIGSGTLVSGDFSTINWANGPYFIKTETDPAGGTNYTITGISQLLSVPYALHTKYAANFNEIDPVFVLSPSYGITNGNISDWNVAHSWGDHSTAGYLTSFTETDPEVGVNTTDFLSKWNGTALVKSSIIDKGSIGIGIIDPGEILHIKTNSTDGNIKMEVSDGDGYYLGYNGSGDFMAFSVINGGNPYWETLNLKSGRVGIQTNNPLSLLDMNIPDNFPSSGINIRMPDANNHPLNNQALTVSSAWGSEGIARANIFSLADDEAAAILTLSRLGSTHSATLLPGAFSLTGEGGNNINMNWEEGFSYGTPTSGYNIQINTETPFNYRTYSGAWIERAKIDNQGNASFVGKISGTGFNLSTGAANGKILTSDASGNASWQPPVGTVPIGAVVAWLKDLSGTPSLPPNFAECNGQTITDPESPFNGVTLPDLGSKFLMGSSASGSEGGSSTHNHTGSMSPPNNTSIAWSGTGAVLASISHTHSISISSSSNLPPYYTIVWIIRVK